MGCDILVVELPVQSGVMSHNFQGFQLKLTTIKTVTKNGWIAI